MILWTLKQKKMKRRFNNTIKLFYKGKEIPVKNITEAECLCLDFLFAIFNNDIQEIHKHMLKNIFKGSKELEVIEWILEYKKGNSKKCIQ